MATMEKYSSDVADCILEKAKKLCREQLAHNYVSSSFFFFLLKIIYIQYKFLDEDKLVIMRLGQVKVETRVECGDARDVICELVEKLSADMLVMGSHGYGLIKR